MNVNAILDAGAAVAAAAAESKAGKTGTDFSDYMSSLNGKSYGDYLEQIFQKASDTYNVSKDLLKAMAKAESDFKSDITSHAGAMGIMQLMPSTAASLGVTDAFDPEQNIMGGAKYISQLLERYNGNLSYAVAAYNAGSGNVSKYGGIPPFKETQNYVAKVMQYMQEGVTIPDSSAPASTGTSASRTSGQTSQSTSASSGTGTLASSGNMLQDLMSKYFDYEDYLEFLQLFTRIIYEKVTGTSVDTGNSTKSDQSESASASQGQNETGKTETEPEKPAKQLTMRVKDAHGNVSTYWQKDSSSSDAYVAYRNMTAGSQNRLAVDLKKARE